MQSDKYTEVGHMDIFFSGNLQLGIKLSKISWMLMIYCPKVNFTKLSCLNILFDLREKKGYHSSVNITWQPIIKLSHDSLLSNYHMTAINLTVKWQPVIKLSHDNQWSNNHMTASHQVTTWQPVIKLSYDSQ
jgi:hypothetical protein